MNKKHVFTIVTTTRRTNNRVRSFAKELASSLCCALKINRGKLNIEELWYLAREYGAKRVVIVCRGLYGNPGRLVFLICNGDSPSFYPLILKLGGIKLAREEGIRLTQPKNITPIAVSVEEPDIILFGQELAAALYLPFLGYSTLEDLNQFESIIYVEKVGSKKTKYVVKFLSPKDGAITGPKIFVREAYYRTP
ncbi:MAG TPA: hypothetical protein ENG54_01760 [Thermofilum sp.]|nr:hypothetical protein [Thermofilum sp.]